MDGFVRGDVLEHEPVDEDADTALVRHALPPPGRHEREVRDPDGDRDAVSPQVPGVKGPQGSWAEPRRPRRGRTPGHGTESGPPRQGGPPSTAQRIVPNCGLLKALHRTFAEDERGPY